MSLRNGHALMGGLSAVEVEFGGLSMIFVSDRGAVMRAQIARDDSGMIVDVGLTSVVELTGQSGTRGPWAARDSEGIALAADGRVFLSFEGDHRVEEFNWDGSSEVLPIAPDFAALQPNSSLEALAISPDGQLWTLPERSGELDHPFPLFRYDGTGWNSSWHVSRSGDFLPVGADFDDQGRYYLLERDFAGLFGFATRIRRFDVGPAGLDAGTTILQTRHGRFSNLEGLSVWRNNQGQLVGTMVSDDNFSPLLPTQLVEIYLPE